MAWTQHILPCVEATALGAPEFLDGHDVTICIAIVCSDENGSVCWSSHAPAVIDPATRINADVPAKDYR